MRRAGRQLTLAHGEVDIESVVGEFLHYDVRQGQVRRVKQVGAAVVVWLWVHSVLWGSLPLLPLGWFPGNFDNLEQVALCRFHI